MNGPDYSLTTLRDLDVVPDVVGAAAGRLAATVKSTVEQGQNLTEASLGDLALEHELLSRARLAKMMAERLGESLAHSRRSTG